MYTFTFTLHNTYALLLLLYTQCENLFRKTEQSEEKEKKKKIVYVYIINDYAYFVCSFFFSILWLRLSVRRLSLVFQKFRIYIFRVSVCFSIWLEFSKEFYFFQYFFYLLIVFYFPSSAKIQFQLIKSIQLLCIRFIICVFLLWLFNGLVRIIGIYLPSSNVIYVNI